MNMDTFINTVYVSTTDLESKLTGEDKENKLSKKNELTRNTKEPSVGRDSSELVENFERIAEPEIIEEKKSLSYPADLELTAGKTMKTVLQEVSTPPTKPGLDTNTDVRHIAEGHTLLTPSTSSKTEALSYSKGVTDFPKHIDVHDHEEIPDFPPLAKVTQMHAGMDQGATRVQENLTSKDKQSSPNGSKFHAPHNQLRELERRQISIERSGNDEKIREYYNTCISDSGQPTKHSGSSSGNGVSIPNTDSESKFTGDSKESDPTRDSKEIDPTRDSEESDPTRDSELTRDNNKYELTRDNEEPSIDQQTQQYAHAVEIHTNDLNEETRSVVKQSLQMETVSIPENKSATYQNMLEPKTQPLEMTVKSDSITVQSFLQRVSIPRKKQGQGTNTDVSNRMEGGTSLTPSTSSKTLAVLYSEGFGDSYDVNDYEEIPNLTEMYVKMDPTTVSLQENLTSRDKEGSPTRLKLHAQHNQPRELVPVKGGRVTITRSKSDENIHEHYNMCLPDSVNTHQLAKHSYDSPLHKPYRPHIRFYRPPPIKRKQSSTKMAKEELRKQYRHRQPPRKDPALPQPISSNKEGSIISPTDHDDCELDNIGMVHEYEEIDLEEFRNAMKSRDPSATSSLKSKDALRKLYKHRAPPKVPTTDDNKGNTLADQDRQTEAIPSLGKAQQFREHLSPVEYESKLKQETSTLPLEKERPHDQPLLDTTNTTEGEGKDAIIHGQQESSFIHGQLEDGPKTGMQKPLHSTAEGSSGHLLSVSDDYMPLIPKRKKKKVNYNYETLNFQQ